MTQTLNNVLATVTTWLHHASIGELAMLYGFTIMSLVFFASWRVSR